MSTLRRLLPVYLIVIFRSVAWTLSVSGPILYGFVWNAFSPSLIFLVGASATVVALLLLMMIREG